MTLQDEYRTLTDFGSGALSASTFGSPRTAAGDAGRLASGRANLASDVGTSCTGIGRTNSSVFPAGARLSCFAYVSDILSRKT